MDAETIEPTDVIEVDSEHVACDGGRGPLGHPRVFLNMRSKGEVTCPYCSRKFVLSYEAGKRGGH